MDADLKLQKLLIFIDIAGKIEGKTKLQKLIFLGETELNLKSGFTFEKYNYGPYSFELSKYLDILKTLELISVETKHFDTGDEYIGKKITYTINDKGRELAEKFKEGNAEFIKAAQETIFKWGAVPLDGIIKYVYTTYMK